MATESKMVDTKQLSKKLSDSVLETINNHVKIVIKSQNAPVAKSAEIKTTSTDVLVAKASEQIDELMAEGYSEDDASAIIGKAYKQVFDSLNLED